MPCSTRRRGTYFKWMGDDDWLAPTFVGRCVEVLDDDPSLILVTTCQGHVGTGGDVESASYDRGGLRSTRPLERFEEMLSVLNESHLQLDPLYGMIRPGPVAGLPRPVILHEDQVFAGRLALAGPFGTHRRGALVPAAGAVRDPRGRPPARRPHLAGARAEPADVPRAVDRGG